MLLRKQRRQRVFLFLSVLVLLLLAVAGCTAFWLYSKQQSRLHKLQSFTPTAEPGLSIAAVPEDLAMNTDMRIEDGIARPLMTPTRKPYVASKSPPQQVAPPEEPPEPPPSLDGQLTSVIISEQGKMIFFSTAEGTIRIAQGMQYNGWQLTDITEDSATFVFADEEKVLQLRHFSDNVANEAKVLGSNPANNPDREQQ